MLPQRKPLRLPNYDYSQNGVYFITFCTREKRVCLWDTSVGTRIARPQEEPPLSQWGRVTEGVILQIPVHYPMVTVDAYVVMPNHVHLLLRIAREDGRAMRVPTVATIVNQLKGAVTKQIGRRIWQTRYYDHIIRDDMDYRARYEYIRDNPRRWDEDEYHA